MRSTEGAEESTFTLAEASLALRVPEKDLIEILHDSRLAPVALQPDAPLDLIPRSTLVAALALVRITAGPAARSRFALGKAIMDESLQTLAPGRAALLIGRGAASAAEISPVAFSDPNARDGVMFALHVDELIAELDAALNWPPGQEQDLIEGVLAGPLLEILLVVDDIREMNDISSEDADRLTGAVVATRGALAELQTRLRP